MVQLLIDNPLLLLFVVAALGYLIGRIKVGGFRLGIAAVLFVGLGIGSLDPAMRLPDFVFQFGLMVFVYTVGLAGGPGFVAAFRRKGLRDNLLVLGMIVAATGMIVAVHYLFDLAPGQSAGLFSGSLTNTPALAAILQYISETVDAAGLDQAINQPVVAYSVAYPMGVLGMILAIYTLQRMWKIDYAAEAHQLRHLGVVGEELQDRTVEIVRNLDGEPVMYLMKAPVFQHVLFGRLQRESHQSVVTGRTTFVPGDLVSVIGPTEDVDRVIEYLGNESDEKLMMDRGEIDFRRIFVSSHESVGRRIADLRLSERFGAVITRIRRGDVDLLADHQMVLQPGDRVRVVAPRGNIGAVSRFFGDSYKALSEIDIGVFGLGIALGLLIGLIPIPLPGGTTFKLGLAGGPLVVGLIVGALGRTGPIVWQLPYNANLTLRQLGVILFLAGVGTRSGYGFASTFGEGGVTIFIAGAIVTAATAVGMLVIGHKVLKIPMSLLSGMLAGLQTQPAVLAFAGEQSGTELPNLGYATVYPVATISKILFAQLLLTVLT
ncbi:MAG: aspartate:alanine exchanger family transporter [Acidimicrobiia bacterium]|nr:aspartate:alanine exchanger family transporter [Acidimicrobiia bacterium]